MDLETFRKTVTELAGALKVPYSPLPPTTWLEDGPWVSTGVGLAGGVARAFALELSAAGVASRFVPLSALRSGDTADAKGAVLFSQSLSPNARLAASVRASRKVAFTSVSPDHEGEAGLALRRFLAPDGFRVHVQSEDHHGAMVRIQSPAAALLAALQWIASAHPRPWARALSQVPDRAQAALHHRFALPIDVSAPAVFVCAGEDPSLLFGLSTKWGEALFDGPPPVFDALELAHGPLQCLFDHPRTVILMGRPTQSSLMARVRAVLEPQRHTVVTCEAQLPGPLALFEWGAELDALILRALEREPERATRWPARGRDAPLYEYGA